MFFRNTHWQIIRCFLTVNIQRTIRVWIQIRKTTDLRHHCVFLSQMTKTYQIPLCTIPVRPRQTDHKTLFSVKLCLTYLSAVQLLSALQRNHLNPVFVRTVFLFYSSMPLLSSDLFWDFYPALKDSSLLPQNWSWSSLCRPLRSAVPEGSSAPSQPCA